MSAFTIICSPTSFYFIILGAECKNRWTRLRERFSREKKIIEDETRSGKEASKKPVWCYYKHVQFLRPFVSGRK